MIVELFFRYGRSVLCRFLTVVAVMSVFVSAALADNWKVVEKSEKQIPSWVNEGQKPGTLMVLAVAPSLQEARTIAEKNLMRSIVQAIATNVNYGSSQSDSNVADGDKVTTKEEFTSSLEIAAAKLPFIKGVSLSEALGQYWERRENKSTKQTEYYLNVLYPMPESELDRMRREFEKYDQAQVAEYNRLEAAYPEAASVEDINSAIASLETLGEYFFDSVRRTRTAGLKKQYADLYRMVTMSSDKTGEREFTVRTTLRGKPFATGKTPEVTSDCASRIKVSPIDNGTAFRVTYSDEDCLEEEQNSLKATLRLSAARLSTTMHF